MKAQLVLSTFLLLATLSTANAQTSDYPGAADLHVLARPQSSFIIGAIHIDNDEYDVPVGPVEQNATHLGKTLTVTGAIDTLAYAGPTTASSFTTYNGLAGQLLAAGYTEVWSCARKTCGAAFYLARILDKPMLDSIHKDDWGFWLNDDLNATNDDIRYGTFRKHDEYILIMGALAPGHPSGALVIRINGPSNEPVLQTASDAGETAAPDASGAPQPTQEPATTSSTTSRRGRLRAAAGALLQHSVPSQ